jgi:hypothetical protein
MAKTRLEKWSFPNDYKYFTPIDPNTKLHRLDARMAMQATVEGFAVFQRLDAGQQFALFCDLAETVNQCFHLSEAVDSL